MMSLTEENYLILMKHLLAHMILNIVEFVVCQYNAINTFLFLMTISYPVHF